MANTANLGTKHECPNCGVKYYDLGKADPLCPKCGASVTGEMPGEETETTEEPKPAKKPKKKAKKTTKKTTKKAT